MSKSITMIDFDMYPGPPSSRPKDHTRMGEGWNHRNWLISA